MSLAAAERYIWCLTSWFFFHPITLEIYCLNFKTNVVKYNIQYNTTQEFDFAPNQLSRQLDTWKNLSGFPLRKFSRLFHKWSLITAPVKLWEPIKAPELKWNNCLTTNTFKIYNSEFRITLDFCLSNSTLFDIWVDFFLSSPAFPTAPGASCWWWKAVDRREQKSL